MIIEFQPRTQNNAPRNSKQFFLEEYLESMIVYEDNYILAVNKPAGIPVYGVSKTCPFGIVEAVVASKRKDTHPVHRLDKDTSGLLVLGKSRSVRGALCKQFSGRRISKTYLALVEGQWDWTLVGIIAPLTRNEPVRVELSEQARKAATAFFLIATLRDEQRNPYSLINVRLFTGRTHQIRAHLSSLGYPIVGDQIYNSKASESSAYNLTPIGATRQFLHAYELTFTHPKTRQTLLLNSPLEPDFGQAILDLRIDTATDSYRRIIAETRAIKHSILVSDHGA